MATTTADDAGAAATPRHDTGIRVRNSLTKQLEPLTTAQEGLLTWYQCGPTVYDTSHIGHACTYVRFDVIRRLLSDHFGLVVLMAQGLTDVDDKIIRKAAATADDPAAVAKRYEIEFAAAMAKLNVRAPSIQLKVTEHTTHIVDFIEEIVEKNHAYALDHGVYFDTAEFGKRHTYGKLQPKRQQNIHIGRDAGAAEHDRLGKRRPSDFALWKVAPEGELAWPSPWGHGRPGWHIECSTMASRVFGSELDLHTGGQDLAFPHHENEMAQSESFHGVAQWGRAYLHSGHVLLKDVKISKSLGNVVSIDDLLENCTVDQFRLLSLLTKYHQSFNFDGEVLDQAKRLSGRFDEFFRGSSAYCGRLKDAPQAGWGEDEHTVFSAVAAAQMACDRAFRNDFDTVTAIRALGDLVTDTNRYMQTTTHDAAGQPTGSPGPVIAVRRLVGSTLRLLGLTVDKWDAGEDAQWECLAGAIAGGTGAATESGAAAASGTGLLAEVQSLRAAVNKLVAFRDNVRGHALTAVKGGLTEKELASLVFSESDAVRAALAATAPKSVVVRDSKRGASWHLDDY